MSSRLFHTVVGVGLSLGAMTVGCASEQAPDTGSDTAEVSTYGASTEPITPPATTPVEKDRFCEVAWPTTKGGPRPSEAKACIDPQSECGQYPGSHFLGTREYGGDTCVRATDVTTCDFEQAEIWQFCKANGTSHQWTCPAGTILANSCVWPENGEAAKGPQQEATR